MISRKLAEYIIEKYPSIDYIENCLDPYGCKLWIRLVFKDNTECMFCINDLSYGTISTNIYSQSEELITTIDKIMKDREAFYL